MNSMAHAEDHKEQIFAAFQQILDDRNKLESNIATREQETANVKNKQILDVASTYTMDGIVKGLADLQLAFGSHVNGLSENLSTEVSKLDELEQATQIETQHLRKLQQIRIVADALHLLTQTHQEQLRILEQDSAAQKDTLEREMAQKRQLWEKEQAEFEQDIQQQLEFLTQERQRQEADYKYELDRQRTVEENDYEQKQRNQEQELQASQQVKERQWIEREQFLADNQSLYEEYQQTVESLPSELEEAVNQARLATRTAIQHEAEVQAELLEKEWEASRQGYEFQLQSLEKNVQNQIEQIETLHLQLQEMLQQSHTLTMRAFGSSPE